MRNMDSGAVYDIVTENARDISHQSFAIKYRSNSNVSDKELPDLNNLPTIKVLGTGGTIASKGTSGHQTAGYKVDLTIENLLEGIPDLSRTCNLNYEQVLNLDSKEIGTSELLILYEKVKEDIKKYHGIVITHGTDTMEETAFFLQLTIETDKPIVLCGSMRPSTAISSDGPMNLYQAIVIAAHPESKARGVLVALNDRIGTGFYITKSNANSLDTFKSIGQGYIGNFVNNEVHYYFPPSKPLGIVYFNLPPQIHPSSWPEIPILYAHQGFNNKLIELVIHGLDAKGLVLATMGAGSMADKTNEFIAKFLKDHEDFPVIYSKRSMDGMVPNGSLPSSINVNNEPVSFGNAIASGYLNPQKCRILLQLCIYSEFSIPQIKNIFRGLYGG